MPTNDLQLDPRIKEMLLRASGSTTGAGISAEAADEEVAVLVRLADPSAPVDGIREVARFGSVITGRASLGRLFDLRQHANVASLKVSRTYAPSLGSSIPEIRAGLDAFSAAGMPEATGRGVIVGICDWGADFVHSNFRTESESRIECLWDQRGGMHARSPQPFGYGRELGKDDIDRALASPDPYAALEYDPADADVDGRGSHGTHVMDIAAGNGRARGSFPGVAPESDLMFCHLAQDDVRPEDTLGDSVRILEAARYIVDRARGRPVVINMSLGRTGGPHDASPLVVQGLDALVQERPGICVVMSGGNYFVAGLHTHGSIASGEAVDLRWRVQPRHDEYAEMEVWYSASDRFAAQLVDPSGRIVAEAELGEDAVVRESGRILASIYHRRTDPNAGDHVVNVFLWPDAPIGTWTTRLRGITVTDGRYHAWIERDDVGSQSRFVSPTGTSSVGSISTGKRTIAVGAYDPRRPATPILNFSSSGPTRDGREKPDISAPGGSIRAARSSRRAWGGRRFDQTTVKSGTSMAAPHVAGVVALMLAERVMTVDEIRDILFRTARKEPPASAEDRLRFGAGRVDATAAVIAARRPTPTGGRIPHVTDRVPVGISARSAGDAVDAGKRDAIAITGSSSRVDETRPPTELLEVEPRTGAPVPFRCAPDLLSMVPRMPVAEADADAAVASALRSAGISIARVDRLRRSRAWLGLRPFGSVLGGAVLGQLFVRLRYSSEQLMVPPATRGISELSRLGVTHHAEVLAPRLLLAVVGHFRDLARRAPSPRDAHALESLGWLSMQRLRDEVSSSTSITWWIPAAPGFVGPIGRHAAVSPNVRSSFQAIRGPSDGGDDDERYRLWNDGLAGRQWRREVGQEADPTGPNRPFYPPTQLPPVVDVRPFRASVESAWKTRLAEVDATAPALSDRSTGELRRCAPTVPSGLFAQCRTGGLELMFDFPVITGARPLQTLRVLAAISPVVEALLRTVHELGWNDLLFQCAGAGCVRGVKLPADRADPLRHHRAARRLSSHSYGIALDVNTFENAQRTRGSLDPRIVAVFETFRFQWGRCFPVKDPMHFEYCGRTCR